jgi:hypothetical protein
MLVQIVEVVLINNHPINELVFLKSYPHRMSSPRPNFTHEVPNPSSAPLQFTMERKQKSFARKLLSVAPILTAGVLSFLCALAGARPGLLQEFFIIRVSRDSTEMIPGIGKVLGAALEELLQHTNVPDAIHLYAVRYCKDYSVSSGSRTHTCSSYNGLPSDTMAWLQVTLTALYATSAETALIAVALHFRYFARKIRNSRLWTFVMLWIAFATVLLATVIVTVIVSVVHILFAKNLPPAVVQFELGSRYMVITLSACVGLTIGLMTRLASSADSEEIRAS